MEVFYLREHLENWPEVSVFYGGSNNFDGVGHYLMNLPTPVDQWDVVGFGSSLLDLATGCVERLKDRSALPPSFFCKPLPYEVHVAPRVVECSSLFNLRLVLDWNIL